MGQHLVAADVAAQEIGDSVLEGGRAQEFRLLRDNKLISELLKCNYLGSKCWDYRYVC